jgi:hypothetical protein
MGKMKLDPETVQVQTLEMDETPPLAAPMATGSTFRDASGCNTCWTSQAVCF